MSEGRSSVRPRLVTEEDRQCLWDNIDIIDCFATDHGEYIETRSHNDGADVFSVVSTFSSAQVE